MLIDLRSDFIARPTPEMIEAMNRAAMEPCSFGLRESPIQRRLEELGSDLLGKQDALFFPTCTMCNQTAINIFCSPGERFIAESQSHCILSEGGAPAALSGAMPLPLQGQKGVMGLADLTAAFDPGDEQRGRTSLLVLENTHNRSGGTILDERHMKAYRETAEKNGVPVHLDGARIFNAAIGLGIAASRLTRYTDSVALSLNKGLSAPMGALLAGEREFIEEAVRVRQRLGGGWRPTNILAAAGIVALERMVDRLSEDHARARRLAEGIAECNCVHVDLESVQTNLVIAAVSHPAFSIQEFIHLLAEQNILVIQFGANALRMAIHWEIEDLMVERVIEVFGKLDRL
jgi:threonine aldolase